MLDVLGKLTPTNLDGPYRLEEPLTTEPNPDLEIAMNTRLPFDVRAAAISRLMVASWKKGWDECSEEWTKGLRESGALATKKLAHV